MEEYQHFTQAFSTSYEPIEAACLLCVFYSILMLYFIIFQAFCVPQTYKPMLHKDHAEDLRHFRIKSKSWAGEQRASRSGFRPLKF